MPPAGRSAPGAATVTDAPAAADGGQDDGEPSAAPASSDRDVEQDGLPVVPALAGLALLAALALLRPWRLLPGRGGG